MFNFQIRKPTTSYWSLSLDPCNAFLVQGWLCFVPPPPAISLLHVRVISFCSYYNPPLPNIHSSTQFLSFTFKDLLVIAYYWKTGESLTIYKSLFSCFGRNNVNCEETQLNNAILTVLTRTQTLCYQHLSGLNKDWL